MLPFMKLIRTVGGGFRREIGYGADSNLAE